MKKKKEYPVRRLHLQCGVYQKSSRKIQDKSDKRKITANRRDHRNEENDHLISGSKSVYLRKSHENACFETFDPPALGRLRENFRSASVHLKAPVMAHISVTYHTPVMTKSA
jgi:hypothetical protein